MLKSKLYFHQALKLLGHIRFIIKSLSSLDSFKVLYIAFIMSHSPGMLLYFQILKNSKIKNYELYLKFRTF
jgi:hypothetical protein